MFRWSAAGEEGLIRRIRRIFPPPPAEVRVPIGDDAACVRLARAENLVLTTDQMVEGIHFRRSTHPADLLGARALTVNLSDLASMGARPRWFLLSLFLPRDLPDDYLQGILDGMAGEARRRGAALVGGNLTAAPVLALDISLAGSLPEGVPPMLRGGGRAGDLLYVSGALGGSVLGLELLESGWRWVKGRAVRSGASPSERGAATQALRRHLAPVPDYLLASGLCRRRIASAAIDISDGLSLDLRRLCLASGVGARIDPERLPLEPAAVKLRGRDRAMEMALHGGEEYRLLFSVPPGKVSALGRLSGKGAIARIGVLTPGKGRLVLEGRGGKPIPLDPDGFDHLRPSSRRRSAAPGRVPGRGRGARPRGKG